MSTDRIAPCIVLLCLCVGTIGCEEEKRPEPPPHRANIAVHWSHSISDGTPHRMTVLDDGTEILTVGHHSHGQFLLLVRYKNEDRFAVINEHGEFSEYVETPPAE